MVYLRKINLEAFLKILVLSGFILYTSGLLKSGDIYLIINPRMFIYVRLGMIIMFVMVLATLGELFKIPRRKPRVSTYALFLAPLLVSLSFSPVTLDPGALPGRRVNLGTGMPGGPGVVREGPGRAPGAGEEALPGGEDSLHREEALPGGEGSLHREDGHRGDGPREGTPGTPPGPGGEDTGRVPPSPGGEDGWRGDDPREDAPGTHTSPADREDTGEDLGQGQGKIILDDNNFYGWMFLIYRNLEDYKGLEIEVEGFVYQDPEYTGGEFVVARFVMVCCAADMQLVGIMAYPGEVPVPPPETWVKVSGTLDQDRFQGAEIPVIRVKGVTGVEKPALEYVYPY